MPKIEVAENIDRPIEEVWAYVADPKAMAEWLASTTEVEMLTENGAHKGGRFREEARFLGRSLEFVNEITEYDPPGSFAYRSITGPFEASYEIELQSLGDSTRVTYRAEAAAGLGGVFDKLIDPVVTAAFRRESLSDLRRLKDILEAQVAEETS